MNSALSFPRETQKVTCEGLSLAVVIDLWLGEAQGLGTMEVNSRVELTFPSALVWKENESDKYLSFFIIRFVEAVYNVVKRMVLILRFIVDRQVNICS